MKKVYITPQVSFPKVNTEFVLILLNHSELGESRATKKRNIDDDFDTDFESEETDFWH